MGKKINEAFLHQYIELDKICCEKFGVATGGVGEYVTRLNNARYAPGREEVLPRLVRYRNIHRRFYHEPGAIRKDNELVKDDIKWLTRFKNDLKRRKDPISKYLKKAQRYQFKKKLVRGLWIFLALALIIAIATLIIVLA